MRLAAVFFVICLIFAAIPGETRGQTPTPVNLTAHRVSIPPKLDGVLDDEAWAKDPLPLNTWMSYNPMRGEAAAEQTSVWIAYDDSAIYFAFRCLDTQPDRIRTNISRRDNAFSDDWVGLSLDSSRAGQLAYHLFVNPSGIQMDALQSGSNGEDFAPDWVWQSAGHVGAEGWSVEIRVPLENIRFRSGPRRGNGRALLASSQPHRRVDLVAGDAAGEMGIRRECRSGIRRTSVTAPARGDSQLDILEQPGAKGRVSLGRFARARGLRRQREIWRHVGGHARRDDQPRFQPGRERRVRSRGQPALSDVLQREAPVLHGRSRAVQSSPAPAAMPRCALPSTRGRILDPSAGVETDRCGRQAYLRRAVIGRCGSRRHASACLHCRSRSHELRPRAVRGAAAVRYRVRRRSQSRRRGRCRLQARRALFGQRILPFVTLPDADR